VVVEEFKEDDTIIRMRAEIMVERKSQKGIVIGHEGKMLKKVGTLARQEMEQFFAKQVFLELYVRVQEDWRSNPKALNKFGYNNT
jgi:GTP-binding protein Era